MQLTEERLAGRRRGCSGTEGGRSAEKSITAAPSVSTTSKDADAAAGVEPAREPGVPLGAGRAEQVLLERAAEDPGRQADRAVDRLEGTGPSLQYRVTVRSSLACDPVPATKWTGTTVKSGTPNPVGIVVLEEQRPAASRRGVDGQLDVERLELLAAAGEGVLAGELLAGAHARAADGDDDERLEAAPAPVDDDRVTDRAERCRVVDHDRVGLRRHHAPEIAGPPQRERAADEVGPDRAVLAPGEHVDLAGVVALRPERAERRVVDAEVVGDEGAGGGLGVGELARPSPAATRRRGRRSAPALVVGRHLSSPSPAWSSSSRSSRSCRRARRTGRSRRRCRVDRGR